MTPNRDGISRRDFIARTAFVGAGLAVGSPAWAAAQEQSEEPSVGHDQENVVTSVQGERRHLGSLEVTTLGLGCMNFTWAYGPPVEKEQAIAVIRSPAVAARIASTCSARSGPGSITATSPPG